MSRLEAMGLSRLCTAPDKLFEDADLVVAAVKPQIIPAALTAIKDQLGPRTALLSIAAGIPISSLQSQLGEDVAIIRCMPNTPAMIGWVQVRCTQPTRSALPIGSSRKRLPTPQATPFG